MSPAKSAVYNSAKSNGIHTGACTPGTWEAQIEMLLKWAHDPTAAKTFWMNGMAGAGKTTITYSVCTRLDAANRLGASFFCSRAISECRQVTDIILSIAYQLTRFSIPFKCALDKVLELNPATHTRELKIQFRQLLVDPLLYVQKSLPKDLIVVIDALDECEDTNSLGPVLDMIISPQVSLPIRFLVSSRPEADVYERMMGRVDEQGNARLVLHDLDADAVRSDITAYMKHELQSVPFTDSQWLRLIDRRGTLFIYASTTCRYIKQGQEMDNLEEAVSTAMRSECEEPEQKIDALYSTILKAVFEKVETIDKDKARMRYLLEMISPILEAKMKGERRGPPSLK